MEVKNILHENKIVYKEKFENQTVRMGLSPGITSSRDYIKSYVEIRVLKEQVLFDVRRVTGSSPVPSTIL